MKTWIIKSALAPIVGWFLHQANCRPPVASRTEFYALKVRLCKRFGWWERAELQHVVKPCWGCAGDTFMKGCGDCMGPHGVRPGVYAEFWVRLERYNVGGFIFHEPSLRYERKIEWDGAEIEGLIEHERPKWNLYSECWLWLALVFDRKLFWRDFSRVKRKGWLPLITAQRGYWCCRNWKQTRFGQRVCRRFGIDDGCPF